MPNKVPFVIYMKYVPERGSGARFEIHRSRERISHLVWRDLHENLENGVLMRGDTEPGDANFAVPGGTIHWTLANHPSSLAPTMSGVALKPQFGEFPAALTIVGFYSYGMGAPYAEKMLIAGGRVHTGPATGAPAYSDDTAPSADVMAAVASLKGAIESAITSVPLSEEAAMAAGVNYWAEIIAIEIAGVRFGRNGLHFPT